MRRGFIMGKIRSIRECGGGGRVLLPPAPGKTLRGYGRTTVTPLLGSAV